MGFVSNPASMSLSNRQRRQLTVASGTCRAIQNMLQLIPTANFYFDQQRGDGTKTPVPSLSD